MWVFEEQVSSPPSNRTCRRLQWSRAARVTALTDSLQIDGRNLTDIINEKHVNVKYLPDITLGYNVVAVPDIVETVKDATAIIFVMPHQCESPITP